MIPRVNIDGDRLWLDGVEVHGLTSVRFEHSVNDAPRLYLELVVSGMVSGAPHPQLEVVEELRDPQTGLLP